MRDQVANRESNFRTNPMYKAPNPRSQAWSPAPKPIACLSPCSADLSSRAVARTALCSACWNWKGMPWDYEGIYLSTVTGIWRS